jgi:hypothetical protein
VIPNLKHIVEQARQLYPQDWKDAHTGNANTEGFIRKCAPMLAAEDARFGLNGKRGNPNDISDDAVNVRGEGPGHNNDGTPCTVIDIIGGAGGPNPQPQWGVQTGAVESTGEWVDSGEAPTPPEPPSPPAPIGQPYPDERTWWPNVFDVEVGARYARAGKLYPDGASAFRWASRTAYDIAAGMTKEESLAKHLKELEQELGL